MLQVEGEQWDHHMVPHRLNIPEVDRVEKVEEEEISCFYATKVGLFQKTLLLTFVH